MGACTLFAGLNTAQAGDISGTVRDGAALPIASVWVDAYDASNLRIDSGLTGTNGTYAITNLAAGAYFLLTDASAGNYVDEWYSNVVAVSAEIPAAALPVAVGIGVVSNIDFDLTAGGSISGRVTTISNAPLSGVWVDAYDGTGDRRGSGLSDVSGDFTIAGLVEGAFYVRTDAIGENYADEWYDDVAASGGEIAAGATAVNVIAGAVTGAVNFALAPGARIAGRVATTGGAPLSGVWVDAYDGFGDLVDSGLTAADGTYAVQGLGAGTYYARTYVGGANYANAWFNDVPVLGFDIPIGQAEALVLAAGSAVTNVNFALAAGGSIAGTVTNSTGAALSGVWIDLYVGSGEWVQSAQTGGGGSYIAAGLPATNFYMRTFAGATNLVDEWYDDLSVAGVDIPAGADPVAVITGAVTGAINFGLRAGGSIAGRVTRTNNTGIAGVSLDVYDAATNWIKGGTTDTGGWYRVEGLPAPAAYYVVTSGTNNVVDEWYDNVIVVGSGIPSGAAAVSVGAGATATNILFVLSDGAAISGNVTGEALAPLAGVTVAAYDAQTNRVAATTTATDGAYAVLGLAAGTFFVRAEAGALNYADGWWRDVPALGLGIPAAASPVVVGVGGSVTGVTFALARGGKLDGTVTAVGGGPLSSIGIDAYDALTNWLKSATTDANGSYALQGLSTQRLVYVRTYVGAANYIDEWFDNVAVVGGGIDTGAQGLALTATGTWQGVDLALAEGGAIGGFVGDVAASPVVGVRVQAYSTGGVLQAQQTTAGNGGFVVSHLPAGGYFVRTDSGTNGFVDQWYDAVDLADGAVPTGALTVTAQAGVTTNIGFALGFRVVSASVTNGRARVFWQAASGTVYRVEQTSDLVTWTNAASGTNNMEQGTQPAPAQTWMEYRDTNAVTTNAVFYRIGVEL